MMRPASYTDLPRWAVGRKGANSMPLPRDMLVSAVRIMSVGDFRGTGFLVRVSGDPEPHLYVVTAHHVIAGQIEVEVQAPNPFANGDLYEPEPLDTWRQPFSWVDLAVAPFQGIHEQAYQAIWLDAMFPFPGMELPDLGAHIYYLGIFEPLKRPMARSGRIGALDQSGIPNEGGYEFNAHLVDCRSYNGFSGSPVVVELSFPILDENQGPNWTKAMGVSAAPLGGMQHLSVLCGMFTAHYSDERNPAAEGAASRFGVGVMLPSDQIKKALMTDEAKKERKEKDAERIQKRKAQQPPLKNAGTGSGTDEFGHFEDLTRKLINVPKNELDEKRKDEG